ncbi:LEAF RUST 10 DISEASE-RESISTANCE LOCUS RECEPTOR-LIKE PROTEIN KINASE-like 2.1 [Rosa sericea]
METKGRSMILYLWVLIVAILVIPGHSLDSFNGRNICKPSSCGDIPNISYPFRLKDDPEHCGQLAFTLTCENNITLLDSPSSGKFYVQAIHYHNQTIRLIDPSLLHNSTIPSNLFPPFVLHDFPFQPYGFQREEFILTPIIFLKCVNPIGNTSLLYVDTAPCIDVTDGYGYFKIGDMKFGDWNEGCSLHWIAFTLLNISEDYNATCRYIYNALSIGFHLQYDDNQNLEAYYQNECGGQWQEEYGICFPHSIIGLVQLVFKKIKEFFATGNTARFHSRWIPIKSIDRGRLHLILFGLFFPARLILGAPLIIAFLVYKWRRRHLSMYTSIEHFLHNDINFGPIRYSYSDIKKMTNRFKQKLGEGGYGCVYKGKLRSGHFGAIKLLGKSKTNGQEFISEVATIGRIHHTNVVQLVGYCVEGSKRALVYDFMPNGSLDKYIYSKEESVRLSIKQMYEISLGVAQGIEYLHQGCDMQILHFDIKPHNILLDHNFIPKISDFGLAKLYPTDDSIVSLTAARGTMGYIAPELFYKNIGGVSFKADVYSFGMLLMEMASKRKNLNAMVERSSQIYFPLWVYDQYSQGKDHLDMVDVTDEEKVIIKKMVITALWCIQLKPSDRPSMKKVIEMLEEDVEGPQIPPKPLLYPQEMPGGDLQQINLNPTFSNVELTWTLSAR